MLAGELSGDESLVKAEAELAPEYVLTRYVTPEVPLLDGLYSKQCRRCERWPKRALVGAAQAMCD